jgi:hypothetical protein
VLDDFSRKRHEVRPHAGVPMRHLFDVGYCDAAGSLGSAERPAGSNCGAASLCDRTTDVYDRLIPAATRSPALAQCTVADQHRSLVLPCRIRGLFRSAWVI